MITMQSKVQTRDGRKVRLLCVDAPGLYPVVGILGDVVMRWTANGYLWYGGPTDAADLSAILATEKAMTPSLPTISALYEKATQGTWIPGESDDGHAIINVPSDNWTEMATFYITTENRDLVCALHAAFPAMRAVVEAAMRVRQIDNDPTARECERDAAIRDLGNALAPFTPPTKDAP